MYDHNSSCIGWFHQPKVWVVEGWNSDNRNIGEIYSTLQGSTKLQIESIVLHVADGGGHEWWSLLKTYVGTLRVQQNTIPIQFQTACRTTPISILEVAIITNLQGVVVAVPTHLWHLNTTSSFTVVTHLTLKASP